MFETIETLLTIAIWAVAILMFVGGILCCIGNLINGRIWRKILSAIAIGLGIYVFSFLYSRLSSIVWCLLASGMVLTLVSEAGSDRWQNTPQKKRGFIDAFVDTYCEYELTKAAVKDAIKESKE